MKLTCYGCKRFLNSVGWISVFGLRSGMQLRVKGNQGIAGS